MTIKEAKAIVRELGLTLIRKADTNEYIVRGKGGDYYTDDLQDAVDTARASTTAAVILAAETGIIL